MKATMSKKIIKSFDEFNTVMNYSHKEQKMKVIVYAKNIKL